ncbi:hypothetical protein Ocin01_17148, partial [Orchesella cincta]
MAPSLIYKRTLENVPRHALYVPSRSAPPPTSTHILGGTQRRSLTFVQCPRTFAQPSAL